MKTIIFHSSKYCELPIDKARGEDKKQNDYVLLHSAFMSGSEEGCDQLVILG